MIFVLHRGLQDRRESFSLLLTSNTSQAVHIMNCNDKLDIQQGMSRHNFLQKELRLEKKARKGYAARLIQKSHGEPKLP